MFPEADIPVMQMSLMSNLSPTQHLKVARVLLGQCTITVRSAEVHRALLGPGLGTTLTPSCYPACVAAFSLVLH